jgi:hypothetical protein
MLGQSVGYNQRDIGAGAALIVAQLGEPAVTPGFCALGFPEDNAGRLANLAVDLLYDVGSQLALADRFDRICRKAALQKLL